MKLELIRKLAGQEIIDYQFLLSMLREYSHPPAKISKWLKSGDLIRVKKGLYVFGEQIPQSPYSLEVLANLIYGPSAVSLSYALSFYGLIPERVTTVTSITNKRNKFFSTPVSEFTYQYLNPELYPLEIEIVETSISNHCLMASLEKALCDYIYIVDKNVEIVSNEDIENYLFHDLRIDESVLSKFRINKLKNISATYEDTRLVLLTNFIKKWKYN